MGFLFFLGTKKKWPKECDHARGLNTPKPNPKVPLYLSGHAQSVSKGVRVLVCCMYLSGPCQSNFCNRFLFCRL